MLVEEVTLGRWTSASDERFVQQVEDLEDAGEAPCVFGEGDDGGCSSGDGTSDGGG